MASATDAAGLAEALLAEALSADGAEAVALWALAPDGGIELVGQAGFGPGEAARWRRIPPGVPSLPQRAAQLGAETWWPAGRPPEDGNVLIGRPGAARAVVPLRLGNIRIGALEACWPDALPEFPDSVRRQLPALALPCAQALSAGTPAADYSRAWVLGLLAGLHQSVLFARAVHGEQGELAEFVIEWASEDFRDPDGRTAADVVGRHLLEAGLPLDAAGAAARVLDSGQPERVPHVGGMQAAVAPLSCGVVIAWQAAADGDSAGRERAGREGAVRDSGASETERLTALLDVVQWLGNTGGWEEDLRTGQVDWTPAAFTLFGRPPGQPVPLAELGDWVPAEDVPAVEYFQDRLLRRHEPATAAFRIVRGDDASIRQLRAFARPASGPGDALVVRGAYQDVSAQYHTQAAFTAAREQLAGTEERARAERDLALRLQQAITPQVSQPVEGVGIDVAARYRPASEDHLVGGDWYDAVPLPEMNVLLAVGDIAGHGIGAVTGMVALRNCLRGLAVTGAGPGQLLTWLNTAAFHLVGVMATAICAIYHPPTRTLCWARAGHLPPLLIRDGMASACPPPRGRLLGAAPDAMYEEATVTLQFGDAILFFTDGLIERRGQPLDDAIAQLARLASRPVTSVGELATHLLASAPSDTGDDSCLVAIGVR
jgi:PAS domain-containing protein